MRLDGSAVSLTDFAAGMRAPATLDVTAEMRANVERAHAIVLSLASGEAPIYGLNTALGGKLSHRIPPDEIATYQAQIIRGRAVACGRPLAEEIGRGVILSRLLSAAHGFSGLSPTAFDHLVAVYHAGLSPVVPEYGSIGASDLVQNAHVAMALSGEADIWHEGEIKSGPNAFAACGLTAVALRPKDGLALINHSGTSIALAARALADASRALDMMRAAAVLSYDGYAANRQIFDDDVNALRVSPGQREAAAWFRDALEGTQSAPRRIQEALSFRTVAVVFGAADDALRRAIAVFEDELNGCADSPVVTDAETMVSTANYMTPGLGLALENLSLALVGVAHASAQRQQKLMHPDFSALPKYLAAPESAAAGFVPSQKTAASLLAEIKLGAAPALPDAPGVSDAVEDVASTTPQSARKLAVQLAPFELLAALEALVAAQAMDLRGLDMCGGRGKFLHGEIRKVAAFVEQDRMLGPDIEAVRRVLRMHGSVHH